MGFKRAARRRAAKDQSGQEKEKAITNIGTAMYMCQSSLVLKKTFDQEIRGTKKERARAGGSSLAESILAAFGIENALKALIRREGKTPGNIHNLWTLYKMLAPDTQERIGEKGVSRNVTDHRNGKVMGIRVEGVIREHQASFQELRYRESGKVLPVIPGLLTDTLRVIIDVHQEKYGEDVKREEEQSTGQVSPETVPERVEEYHKTVFVPKRGFRKV